MSERQACSSVGIKRSVYRYVKVESCDSELRQKLIEEAEKRKKYGYRMLHQRLRRAGFMVNHKRVYRLYREENLALRRKKRSKKVVRERVKMEVPNAPNKKWSMDFVHDSLQSGRAFRCLTVIDVCSRYAPVIEVSHSITSKRVIEVLERLSFIRGLPEVITVDNGPEFVSLALREWTRKRGVRLEYIQPGRPMQNGFIESFNGTFRHECLDSHSFLSLRHARRLIEQWREEYNNDRTHSSIKDRTPEEVEIDFFQKCSSTEKLTYAW